MKPNATSPFGKQFIAGKLIPIRKCLILVASSRTISGRHASVRGGITHAA